jgi:hypothetical protein
VKVLITSSRMPFALGLVRKLAAEGREIYAADDHFLSPGNHSRRRIRHLPWNIRLADDRAWHRPDERVRWWVGLLHERNLVHRHVQLDGY